MHTALGRNRLGRWALGRWALGRWATLAWCVACVTCRAAAAGAAPHDAPSFALDVRPILSNNCFLCHGPDEGTREADLRLDTSSGVQFAFSAAEGEVSEAWRRITSDDPDIQMPPPSSGKRLSAADRAVLQRWIDDGAKWSGHWSFQPLLSIEPPHRAGWGAGPIDAFIHLTLQREGLAPALQAPKETLIRRVAFDLTGLPPTLDEIDAFLADEDPDAYERLVDRLLAAPRFGERVAAVWLDAARYSDTYGYQRDEDRFVWPWRDWVVRALNNNMPYDEFIRQQIAGDLLENAPTDAVLATVFNRLHGQNSEGGSVPEEFRAEYVADRTQTFASAFLGLTMECCKCHDHKYDPFSQRDFYALSAFFDKIDESGIKSFFTDATPTPTLRLIDDQQRARLASLRDAVAEAERRLAEVVESENKVFADRSAATLEIVDVAPEPALQNHFDGAPDGANRTVDGLRGAAVQLTGDDEQLAVEGAAFDRDAPFSISLWLRADRRHERAVVFHRTRAAIDSGSRGYELLIEQGKLSAALIHFWPGNAIRVQAADALPLDRWIHVGVTYDGSSRADGLRLFVDGRVAATEEVRNALTKTVLAEGVGRIAIGARFRDRGFTGGQVDEFCVLDRQISAVEMAALASRDGDGSVDQSPTASDRFEHYLLSASDAARDARNELASRRRELYAAEQGSQEIMAMRDFAGAPPTHIRVRGAYDQLGDVVDPGVPNVLPPLPNDRPADRLALANWMCHPSNPLTSRVAVNRFWQMAFGDGLVRTPEDFGAQGEPPTHPQLLDYLAHSFIQDGWNVKALLKRMVMSETYRQSSTVSAEAFAADPKNRLFGRASRRRWTAEMLRDNALAASGLLVDKLGGPPVKPYESSVSFSPTPHDKGDGLYRRSLYTYCKRSAPAPVMATFDAPDRSVCRVQRERTKTPLQALVLMNGPQFVEAARVLGERALQHHGADDVAVVHRLFRSLTSVQPTPDETTVLAKLLKQQRRRFERAGDQATELISIGERAADPNIDPAELAAATVVAQTIMNCDKCLVRQ